MTTWTGWLREGRRWQRAVSGHDIEDVHARLLEAAKAKGLPLTVASRLITRGNGKGEYSQAEDQYHAEP